MRNTKIKKYLSCILAASLFWSGAEPTLAQEEAVIMLEDEKDSLSEEGSSEGADDTVQKESESEWTDDTEEVSEQETIQILDCEAIAELSSEEEKAAEWNVETESEETKLEDIEPLRGELLSGSCGDTISWTFDTETGLLTISGEGTIVGDKESVTWSGLKKSDIQSIVIKEGITEIGNYAFYGCSALETIDIPDGVTSIGSSAFEKCSAMKTIDIPAGVTSIEYRTFYNCSVLETIDISEGVTSIGNYAFYGCSAMKTIDIPAGVTSIGDHAFDGCSALKTIDLPEGITHIKSYLFYNCSALETVELPDGVTSIGSAAFKMCSALKTIELPEEVTRIGFEAFYGCSALETIDIPDGVTSIVSMAFDGCSALESITIPKGVTHIESWTFSGCSALKTIDLPEGVTSIGKGAFSHCISIKSIEIPKGVTSISESTFSGCSALETIKLSEGVTSIGKKAFSNCISIKSIEIPKGITSIGNDVFTGCILLTSIKLPALITSVDFSTIDNLKEIYGYANTYAAAYAIKEGYAFIDLGIVEEALNAIPDLEALTLNDTATVNKARTEYNKIGVPTFTDSALREKLFAAEAKLANLSKTTEAESFIRKCLSRPNLTTIYRKAVEAARESYNQLTQEQQALFDVSLYAELLAAEADIAALDEVTVVSGDLQQFPESADLTLEDKASVEAIQETYDALSPEQKAQIAPELVGKLNAAVARIAELEAIEEVRTEISLLPELSQLTIKDKDLVEQLRADYDALTVSQQAEVGTALLDRLMAAEASLKELEEKAAAEAKEAALAERAIAALWKLPNLTTTNRAAVETARLIYDALSQAQQEMINQELTAKLFRLEAEIAELKKVENVQDTASNLPELSALSMKDKALVTAIRTSYEALSEEQKQQFDDAFLKWLLAAEARIAELENHVHVWGKGIVTKAATCTTAGSKTYQCSCGETKTETIAAAGQHIYGGWQTVSEATIAAAEQQKHICTICGAEETQSVGEKLTPVLEVPGKLSAFNMKKGSASTFVVTKANGDSVASVRSNKTAVLKATLAKKTGKITLKAVKNGTAKLTIKLASGKKRTYTVKVVTGTIKTTALSVTSVTNKKLTLAKGKTHTLKVELKPFTSTQKLTYSSSNKKVATVTSAGKIRAVGVGKATVTVRSGSKNVKVTVTVPGIANVKSAVTVKKGKTLTLAPKTYGISEKVTYTSSDPKIATVTSKGKIKGIKKGTAKITITAGNYKQIVTVKVS